MDVRTIQNTLNTNGFPCAVDGVYGPGTKAAVARFQTAYCGPDGYLAIDGVAGPATERALGFLPHLSTHFIWTELCCKHCGKTYVHRDLLSALEALRDRVGPVSLLDAYRCEIHNAQVGGVGGSQHLDGRAADLARMFPLNDVIALRRFSGIGSRGNLASHVDVRTNASPAAPARWAY